MKFSEQAWKATAAIYERILQHPFNQELTQGTLERARFQFYMKQDSLYLVEFARALALAASKAAHPDDIVLLLDFSKGAIVAERSLHQFYFDLFDITLDTDRAPGCFAYTSFLMDTCSHKSYEEGVAALLPCFWIYREVGLHIHKNAAPDNPYQKWIDTYSGEEFSKIVDDAIDLTDRVAETADAERKEKMLQAFVHSTRLEWMFWDSAYRMETWPPEGT